jgi:hypothetical protein
LPELQTEQTYCDYSKNIEKNFSRESKIQQKRKDFFVKKKNGREKKIGRKKNCQKKIWLKKNLSEKNIWP